MRVSRPSESVVPYTPEPTSIAHPGQPPDGGAAPSYFSRLLDGLGRELDAGERLAVTATRGTYGAGSMSPEALLTLQAGIYRYSEAVDLFAKLVDRGTQAVRTTLQNQ